MHLLIVGLLLGWGAAIPIGPMNLEIIRRNLRGNTACGLSFGFGACSADLLYLVFLAFGTITVITHPTLLKIIGIIGSCILVWFGVTAIRMHSKEQIDRKPLKAQSVFRHYIDGLLLTLVNPITILFWSSVSVQVAALSQAHTLSVFWLGLGVIVGTLSWASGLNLFLHLTRHRLSAIIMHRLNLIGGVILIGFAAFGFYHALAI